MNIGHQPPAEARADALFNAFQIGRRAVGGDNDLTIMVNERVKGVEKFFLRRILAGDELNIVNHQHINLAKLLFERHCVLETQCTDKLIHEFFRRQIQNCSAWVLRANFPRNGMHEMGFTQPHTAV